MRRALLILLLLALPLGAQDYPDFATKLELDRSSASTGERVRGTLTAIHVSGPIPNVVTVDIFLYPREQEMTIAPPADWSCEDLDPTHVVRCSTTAFEPHAQVAIPFTILLRNDLPTPSLRIFARTVSSSPDAKPADNEVTLHLPVVEHSSVAALSIAATPQQKTVLPGTPHVVTLDVRNDGPSDARNVLVRIRGFGLDAATLAGAGWTCTARHCTRPLLGSGESAPVTLTIPTRFETTISFAIEAGAEDSFDPTENLAYLDLGVGDPATWQRTLLPVAMAETPGANGSLWRTDITAVLNFGLAEIRPRYCAGRECPHVPIDKPFDLLAARFARPDPRIPSSLLFIRNGDLDLNLRVRDLTRTAETWGTEIPAVRDREFRTSTITLMPLPVDPLFRTTLRVYDLDARPGATVAIHVHADQEEAPRATLVRTLTALPATITTSMLPMFPGYLQLDPIAEAGDVLAGAETVWIRVEPRTEGLRFWAFASVTNNPTGHVTTVTP